MRLVRLCVSILLVLSVGSVAGVPRARHREGSPPPGTALAGAWSVAHVVTLVAVPLVAHVRAIVVRIMATALTALAAALRQVL